jgi:ferrochelatase
VTDALSGDGAAPGAIVPGAIVPGAIVPGAMVPGATAAAASGAEHVTEPTAYDAVLLASFGGPEGQDDVIPFLRNVTRGRGIPEERLEEVAHHYRAFGGVSPINAQNRELKAALEAELASRGIELPVLWGNRNWNPYLADTLREAADAGHTKLIAIATSAYSSYSSCRQYREDFAEALDDTGLRGTLQIDKVRQYFDHPGFVLPFIEGVQNAYAELAERVTGIDPATEVEVLFTTHSIPSADAARSGPADRGFGEGGAYEAQHRAVAEVIMLAAAPSVSPMRKNSRLADAAGPESGVSPGSSSSVNVGGPGVNVGGPGVNVGGSSRKVDGGGEAGDGAAGNWQLVFQSRSGPPSMPWLEPDINDVIALLPARGIRAVIIVPLGFVSDHMEVKWDLDNEALASAEEAGLAAVRVPTPGVHADYVKGLVDLVMERVEGTPVADRPALTALGPWYDVCRAGCCENVRLGFKSALAGIAP